jgi:hypothetical protein
MLIFLGVLLTGYSLAQVQTNCSTNGTSSGGQINATTNCTSTDTGAAVAERNRENAEAGQAMGNALGTGLAAAIQNHRNHPDNHHDKKVHKRLCREGVLPDDSCTAVNKRNEKANKNLKNNEILSSTDEQVAYCKTHPNDALVCKGVVAERKVTPAMGIPAATVAPAAPPH